MRKILLFVYGKIKMSDLQMKLPGKIYESIERAGIATSKQIILLSTTDIAKATHMCREDIIFLKNIVSECAKPISLTCDKLENSTRISSGCIAIDNLLNGGFQRGTITEIYGESGSGKTQIAIQAAAYNWPDCTIYICTEDLFPIKRFNEIKTGIPNHKHNIEYGSNVLVEHITESADLLSCIRVRISKILAQKNCTLIVIDSVAAPFRVESTNYVQRAEDLRELAISLITIAQQYNLAILCINQVSSSIDGPVDILPSLGLAWSNMVNTRLYLKKKSKSVMAYNNDSGEYSSPLRELSVIFAPDIPNAKVNFVVTNIGLKSVKN